MAETWVFVVTDPAKMADVAAAGIHDGWLRSLYRVEDTKRIRTFDRQLYDQDAER